MFPSAKANKPLTSRAPGDVCHAAALEACAAARAWRHAEALLQRIGPASCLRGGLCWENFAGNHGRLAARISLVLEMFCVESQKCLKNATLEPVSLVWQRSKVAMYQRTIVSSLVAFDLPGEHPRIGIMNLQEPSKK